MATAKLQGVWHLDDVLRQLGRRRQRGGPRGRHLNVDDLGSHDNFWCRCRVITVIGRRRRKGTEFIEDDDQNYENYNTQNCRQTDFHFAIPFSELLGLFQMVFALLYITLGSVYAVEDVVHHFSLLLDQGRDLKEHVMDFFDGLFKLKNVYDWIKPWLIF